MAALWLNTLTLLLAVALPPRNVASLLRSVSASRVRDVSAQAASPITRCTASFRPQVAVRSTRAATVYLEGAYAEALDRAHDRLPGADRRAIKSAANASGPRDLIGCSEDAYGEIPPSSATALFRHEAVQLQKDDVLFDLGAGLGGLAVDACLLGNARRAVGVEISAKRLELGCKVLQGVQVDVDSLTPEATRMNQTLNLVELREGDLFDTHDLGEATVVYVASFCFRNAMMDRLAKMLLSELRPGARIISLKAFPEDIDRSSTAGRQLVKIAEAELPMTWTLPGYAQSVGIYKIQASA